MSPSRVLRTSSLNRQPRNTKFLRLDRNWRCIFTLKSAKRQMRKREIWKSLMGGGGAEGLSRGRNHGFYAEPATPELQGAGRPGAGPRNWRLRDRAERPPGWRKNLALASPRFPPLTPIPAGLTSNERQPEAPGRPYSPRAHRRHSPTA